MRADVLTSHLVLRDCGLLFYVRQLAIGDWCVDELCAAKIFGI